MFFFSHFMGLLVVLCGLPDSLLSGGMFVGVFGGFVFLIKDW